MTKKKPIVKIKRRSKLHERISDTSKSENCPTSVSETLENQRKSHKEQLADLQKTDPDFYKFLQEQDADIFDFEDSDNETHDSEGGSDVEDKAAVVSNCYENASLRVDRKGRKIVNREFIDMLKNEFESKDKPSSSVVRAAVEGFLACVARVGANIDPPSFLINEGKLFEEMVRLCFKHMKKALFSMLNPGKVKTEIMDGSIRKPPQELNEIIKRTASIPQRPMEQFKRWKKHSALVKRYLNALLLFLNEIQASDVVASTLHAVIELIELYVHFTRLSRNLLKILVRIWSQKSFDCRCIAFRGLCKLIQSDERLLSAVLKSCYFAYVSNTRAVTSETWPLIVFMQKSFAEIGLVNPSISYQYVFVYIRQTAIHVRNAMIAKRKDLLQTVYNWQFIQCLYIWARFISRARRQSNRDGVEAILELAYPLCQIIITNFKLFSSIKYFPLRLHCLQILLLLQVNCHLYIQIFPLAVGMLDELSMIIKKKPTTGKGVEKSVDINYMLKANSSQIEDSGFRQNAAESLFRVILEASLTVSDNPAFPDLVTFSDLHIKRFLKKCKCAEHSRLFKSLNSKLNEQAKHISGILASKDINLKDQDSVISVCASLKSSDSPLAKFHRSWKNVWKIRQQALNENQQIQGNLLQPAAAKPRIREKTSLVKEKMKSNEREENSSTNSDNEGISIPESDSKQSRRNSLALNKSEIDEYKPDTVQDFALSDSEEEN